MTPLSEAIILGSPTTPVALGIPPVPLLAVRRATELERWEGVSIGSEDPCPNKDLRWLLLRGGGDLLLFCDIFHRKDRLVCNNFSGI